MRTIISQTCNLPTKPKTSSEDKPAKVRQLQALTIADLDAPREADLFEIAGGGIITSP